MKTYTFKEIDAERHNGWQVVLSLKPESGSFELTCGTYSSDWGDRHEKLTQYYGSYTEDDAQLVCVTIRVEAVEHLDRHEEGDGHENRSWKPSAEVFAFPKQQQGLVCPVAFEGALGKVMLSEVEPIKLF